MSDAQPWRETMSWNELRAGGHRVLAPDEQARRRIARLLDLQGLDGSRRIWPSSPGWKAPR